MTKQVVAIVGRPNVGKSSFFNAVIGERISIVHNTPGITRDRIYAEAEWLGREFVLVDTGGIEPDNDDIILRQMRDQAEVAIRHADVIVFMTELKTGLLPADEEIAVMLRKSGKPVVVAVNKCDNVGDPPPEIYDFYQLGISDVVPISAEHRLGLGELFDSIVAKLTEPEMTEDDDDRVSVAIIGKPNVGKSSLVNKMLGEERTIVSDIAGTTRDALDIDLDHETGRYRLIDTAGLRRKSKVSDRIEKYSILRTVSAVERSTVCLILIDATEGVTEQDTKVAGLAHNAGKASIIVVNKWDLVEDKEKARQDLEADIARRFAFMSYAPHVFISAKTGARFGALYETIQLVAEEAGKRLSTGVINDVLGEAVAMNPAPQDKGKRLRLYYGTQVASHPPTLLFFVNDNKLMHFSYERYLENQFRKNFGFEGSPLRMIFRNRKREER